jgi:hypothetical protein
MLKLPQPPARHGQPDSETALLVARGTRRMLRRLNFSTLTELQLFSGRRADIVALSRNGLIFIVEIKSSVAELRFDTKWRDYCVICDRFYFAIPENVPADLIPQDAGLILADAYSADIVRPAPEHPIAPATRRGILLRFANEAAVRLQRVTDPEANPHGAGAYGTAPLRELVS